MIEFYIYIHFHHSEFNHIVISNLRYIKSLLYKYFKEIRNFSHLIFFDFFFNLLFLCLFFFLLIFCFLTLYKLPLFHHYRIYWIQLAHVVKLEVMNKESKSRYIPSNCCLHFYSWHNNTQYLNVLIDQRESDHTKWHFWLDYFNILLFFVLLFFFNFS